MAEVIFFAVMLALFIFGISFAIMYSIRSKKNLQETDYISDRDILLYLDSPEGIYSTIQELADHFGISKHSMRLRMGFLSRNYVTKPLSDGLRHSYRIRFPISEKVNLDRLSILDHDSLLDLFAKHENQLTLATLILETGQSVIEIKKFLKIYLANKTIRRIYDAAGDRRYVLASRYRTPALPPAVAGEQKLDLKILEFARLNDGTISIENLVEENQIDRGLALKTLAELEEKDLLKLELDPNGSPIYRMR